MAEQLKERPEYQGVAKVLARCIQAQSAITDLGMTWDILYKSGATPWETLENLLGSA